MAQSTTRTAAKPTVEAPAEAPVHNLPAARPRANAVNAIVPSTWQEVTAIAGAICRAGMAPKSYLDKDGKPLPEKVAIAIMHGMEVGMTPMAALQSLAVINGMPSLYGDGMLAVVRASGLLEDFVEDLEWDDKGPLKATCKVKRKGEPTWGVMDCARHDAQIAGWWDKVGPWKLTPHRMLQMRARGWALRDKFADVLRGLHSAEEMQDMVDITPRGSATTEPAAPEPKRADYVPPATEVATAQDQATPGATPHSEPAKNGQAESPPPDGGAKAGPSGQPAPDKKPDDKVTDVVDENDGPEKAKPGEKLEFARFGKVAEFADFADAFIPKTNAEGARQFAEFYDGTLIAMERGKKGSQEAAAEIRAKLRELMGEREPGQEG